VNYVKVTALDSITSWVKSYVERWEPNNEKIFHKIGWREVDIELIS